MIWKICDDVMQNPTSFHNFSAFSLISDYFTFFVLFFRFLFVLLSCLVDFSAIQQLFNGILPNLCNMERC